MKSLTLALFVAAGIALAGPVTVDQVFNGSPCLTGLGFGTGPSGIGTFQVVLNVSADYVAPPPGPSDCTVTLTAELATDGPLRPGFLTFAPTPVNESGLTRILLNGVLITFCGDFICNPVAPTIPITLGENFEVVINAVAHMTGMEGGSTMTVPIGAYENTFPFPNSPNTPLLQSVAIVAALATPEPGASALTLVGMGLMLCGRKHFLKKCSKGTK